MCVCALYLCFSSLGYLFLIYNSFVWDVALLSAASPMQYSFSLWRAEKGGARQVQGSDLIGSVHLSIFSPGWLVAAAQLSRTNHILSHLRRDQSHSVPLSSLCFHLFFLFIDFIQSSNQLSSLGYMQQLTHRYCPFKNSLQSRGNDVI